MHGGDGGGIREGEMEGRNGEPPRAQQRRRRREQVRERERLEGEKEREKGEGSGGRKRERAPPEAATADGGAEDGGSGGSN